MYIVSLFFFLVYFLGIEENRKLAREHFQSRIRIFKRNQVASLVKEYLGYLENFKVAGQ